MKEQISILKAKFGTYREVAAHLEITERHLMGIVNGTIPSAALRYRINAEAEKELKRLKKAS